MVVLSTNSFGLLLLNSVQEAPLKTQMNDIIFLSGLGTWKYEFDFFLFRLFCVYGTRYFTGYTLPYTKKGLHFTVYIKEFQHSMRDT